jgi:hypothetical protein
MNFNVAVFQGLYFLISGVWPILHMGSFVKITGPKTDLWLVKTVGVLLSVIGAALLYAGLHEQITPAIFILGIGSAAALTAIEVIYVSKKIISPIYLLDAVIEIFLIIWWKL